MENYSVSLNSTRCVLCNIQIMGVSYVNEFPRDYLVRVINEKKLVLHISNVDSCDFNIYAKKSLEIDNDAKRRSNDEAVSIHIITSKLNTNLNILYESQICEFYGKPDFIIRLGKKLYIMVSTTRAICRNKSNNLEFNQQEADRLMIKKLSGLSTCKNNLDCLIDDVIDENHTVIPVLHILAPNKINAIMCITAYKKIADIGKINLDKIKIIISCIKNHEKLL